MPQFRKNVFKVNDVYQLAVDGKYDDFFGTGEEVPGVMWGWGRNYFGALGLTTDGSPRSSPVQLGGNKWICTSTGLCHTLGRKSDGTLWTWGGDGFAQLGQGCLINRSSPIQIPGNEWKCIKATFFSGFATKKDGSLWAWGNNYQGTLGVGIGAGISISSPTQVGGVGWNCIHGSMHHFLATKTDGTLWAWGRGSNGQLGNGDVIHRSSPTQILGTEWTNIGAGCNVSYGLKKDGSLWAWGDNGAGQLGQQDTINRNTPVQIPGNNWCCVSSLFFAGHALKTDGTLWAWGQNYSPGSGGGWLGDGTTITRSSPVQIPGNQWAQMCSNEFGVMALKTDGTLWTWGRNLCGQLGLGNTINRSSPSQIPGTWISVTSPGPVDMFAKKIA